MKKVNRILALFLVMVLVIGVLPMSVFAADLQHTESTDSVATEEVQEETEAVTESTELAVEATTPETTTETVPETTAATTEATAEDTEATEATVPADTTDPTEATEPAEPAQNEQPATIPALAQKIVDLPSLQASRTTDTLWILGEYQISADPRLEFGNNYYYGIRKMYFGSYSSPTYAYCIKPSIETDSNTDYYSDPAASTAAWKALGRDKQQAITLTMAYGFPTNFAQALPNSSDGWVQAAQYAATQVIIWEFTEGYRDSISYKRTSSRIVNSFSDNSAFMSAYNTIAGLLEKHGFTPSFTGPLSSSAPTIELKPDGKGNYVASVTDANKVLANWTMPSVSGIAFSKSGNTLTITATAAAAKELANSKSYKTTNPTMPNKAADSVLTWASASTYNTYQPVATFLKSRQDPAPAYFKLHAQATGHAAVTKTSEDGKVSGISFQLKQGSTVLEEKKTDSNGKITFTTDLLDGTKYIIHEVTPAGYVAQADKEITAVANQVITVSFRNTNQRGSLVVTKTSAKDGSALAGIPFRLTGTSTTGAAVNVVATTDSTGTARFTDILVGSNYTITEVQDSATAAWIVPDPITGIQITAGNTTANPVKVTMENSDLTIKKVSENGMVSGIIFEISGGDLASTLTVTTDDNGEIHVGNALHAGKTYTVHEVAPDAYVQPQDQQITVKNDTVNELTFENKLKKWTATVTKVDIETGTAQGDGTLAGAVYGVYQGDALVDSYTTDENGQFTTKEYVCGDDWTIREISPSQGYRLNPGITHVGAEAKKYTIEHNALTIGVQEATIKGKVAIIKYAGGSDYMVPEEGAIFQIWLSSTGSYDSAKDSEKDTITTNEAGFAQSTDLPYGTYTVHQVSGKYDHYLVDDFQVVISESGKTYYYNLLNQHVPEIHTSAASAGMQDVYTEEFDGITDTVSYKHLIIGKTYAIRGVLMDKTNGQPFLDADGKKITSEVTWIADKTEGEVEVHFDFDIALVTEKTTLVVFESLVKDGIEVASHADLEDVDQTVTIHTPEIHTTATVNDDKIAYNTEVTEIVDTVEYTGLIPNVEHTIHGTLMDKATGKELLVDGKPVTASAAFTPESPDGAVEISFKLDGKLILTTTETVAFESLTRNGTEIAVHADIDDEGQTVEVRVPGFHTTATVNEAKDAFSQEDITITDVIHYEGAIPGVELTAKGVLMDKSTGEIFQDSKGEAVVAEAAFTPEDTEGDVTVIFTFDAKSLKETTDLVVFETIFHGDVEVGSHEDLEDEGQTVTIHVPELHTTATINGKHDVTTTSTVTIQDKVAYKGLIVGKEYTIKGVLMDKSTGKPCLDAKGKEITAEAKFTADKADGEITLSFTFDAKGLKKATTLVVFEHLYLKELEIGAHADLQDADQTVTITPPPAVPHTGNNDLLFFGGIAILGVLILATGIVLLARKRKIQ